LQISGNCFFTILSLLWQCIKGNVTKISGIFDTTERKTVCFPLLKSSNDRVSDKLVYRPGLAEPWRSVQI